MDHYTIAENSPFGVASVDDKTLRAGGAPVQLTKDQVERVKSTGVQLDTVSKTEVEKAKAEADASNNETEG